MANLVTTQENVYGIEKKLLFIIDGIENYLNKEGVKKESCLILDVGCGTGINITFPLAERGYKIIGIDSDKDSIEVAKKLNTHSNLKFEQISIEILPGKYDIVVCSEVLEHIPNPVNFLWQLKSKLKLRGVIIITVPNGYGWFELENLLYNMGLKYFISLLSKMRLIKLPPADAVPNTLKKDDKHLQHFTLKKLKSLFEKSGLKIIRQQASTLFAGPITNSLFWKNERFIVWNAEIINKFNFKLASGWYFILSHND